MLCLVVLYPPLLSAGEYSAFNEGGIIAQREASGGKYQHEIVIHTSAGEAYFARANGNLSHPLMHSHEVRMLIDKSIVEIHTGELHYHGVICAGKGNICLASEWVPIPKRPVWEEVIKFNRVL
jgi:hypothetical protein